jgi:hypothetical protein
MYERQEMTGVAVPQIGNRQVDQGYVSGSPNNIIKFLEGSTSVLKENQMLDITPRDSTGIPVSKQGQQIDDTHFGTNSIITSSAKQPVALQENSDKQFIRVLRQAVLAPILSDLDAVAERYQSPLAIGYASDLLRNLRDYARRLPDDCFGSLMFAFHDALSYKNRWVQIEPQTLLASKKVIEKYASQSNFSEADMPKAIQALEVLGLNTTPFEISLEALAAFDELDDVDDEEEN